MAKYDAYVICTSPRSGSTLLCNLLAASGVAGNPASYFHNPSISDWQRHFKLAAEDSMSERDALDSIFKAAISEGSLNTGTFGLRLQRRSFEFFTEKLAVLHPGRSSDSQRLQAAFGRTCIIHLTRLDKVEQAVSHVKRNKRVCGMWRQMAQSWNASHSRRR